MRKRELEELNESLRVELVSCVGLLRSVLQDLSVSDVRHDTDVRRIMQRIANTLDVDLPEQAPKRTRPLSSSVNGIVDAMDFVVSEITRGKYRL